MEYILNERKEGKKEKRTNLILTSLLNGGPNVVIHLYLAHYRREIALFKWLVNIVHCPTKFNFS